MVIKKIFLFLIVCFASYAFAEEVSGKVIGISDGDTITLLVGKLQHKIRLEHIDAPESSQSFGTKAKKKLSDLLYGKTATVELAKKDRYGRYLGIVFVGSQEINLEMVRSGFAWHFKKFSKSSKYADAEEEAKSKKLGLWSEKKPIPPWEYRDSQKNSVGDTTGTYDSNTDKVYFRGKRGGCYYKSEKGNKIYVDKEKCTSAE